MTSSLTQLCRQECLRLLRELPRHATPRLLLHTLKANVHALGLTQLARQIHAAEEKQIVVSELPLKQWMSEIERLHPLERNWEETLSRMAREQGKNLKLHWHGPELTELTSLILHLARNTIAHGQRNDLTLWVTVKQRRDMWHVQVRDDAGGLASHSKAPDLLSGRGEGLNYVHQTMKSWGGRCGILSNPGVGLTITLEFPLQILTRLSA